MNVKPVSRVRKLLDGWQAGAIVVAIALLAVVVAVPRPVLPDDIPMPRVNLRALSERSQAESVRAESLVQKHASYDVRALGEAIRQYGAADADGDSTRGSQRLQDIVMRVGPALAQGPEPVLALRAYQMKVFLLELRQFEQTGRESVELRELGGGIIAMLRRSGWIRHDAQGVRVIEPEQFVLEALYRKRWNELTGLKAPPFAPTLDEQRVLYAFLLTHPIVAPTAGNELEARCRSANEYMLRKVGELAAIDRSYPADVAAGMLLLRLGRNKQAIEALAGYIETHPDGPWTMRARNALRAAHARLEP